MKKIKQNIVDGVRFAESNPDMSITKCAEVCGIDRHTLAKYKKQGIEKYDIYYDGDYYYLDDKERKAINHYLNDESATFAKIQSLYGYKSETFKKKLEVSGLGADRRYKVDFNREAFKTIDTEESAYWLGFILADGYLHEGRGSLTIKLGAVDRDHLKKFCDFIECSHSQIMEQKGGFGTIAYSVNLNSKDMSNDLVDKKIRQSKSGKEEPYSISDSELRRHYIRGILDGDGWIRKDHSGVGLVGSEAICQYFIDDTGVDNVNVGEHDTIHKVELRAKEQVERIVRKYYENSNIFLDRKKKLAQAIMKNQ